MTINQLINQFNQFLTVQKQRSQHTIQNYCRDIEQFFFILEINDPNKILDHHIHQYLNHLSTNDIGQRSIHRKMSSLDQFWRYLVHEDYCQLNPWTSVRRPKISQKIPVYIEEKAMFELLNNYPRETVLNKRNIAILELLFSSGIRVNELVQLTLENIDFTHQECRVFGKGSKERIALFGSRAKVAIQHYLNDAHLVWDFGKTNRLFISKQGQPITIRTVQRIVKDANQYHSSTVEITPHACRHTCASMLISNGAGIRDIQELLGHSSITTTERYSHIPTKTLTKRYLNAIEE
tara:strand:- start:698 stop:1576 length:879 start_codon:yes stop_codon:yes gene_type:complete